MAWDITRTEGGQVIISFGQLLDAMVIDKGASKNVTSANTLAATPSVTNNGTLNIDLSAATAPENKTTTIRYLAGTEADAVVNTGTDSDVIITLLNETSADPDKPGNTAYAGSIEGAAQLVKDGEQRLTVDGRVTASALDVQQGELALQNTKESSIISGALNVEQDAALTLNAASLAAGDLAGSGSITLNGGALLSIARDTLSDLTLHASVTGSGTLKLDNCNLILGTDNNLGEDVLLHLGAAACVCRTAPRSHWKGSTRSRRTARSTWGLTDVWNWPPTTGKPTPSKGISPAREPLPTGAKARRSSFPPATQAWTSAIPGPAVISFWETRIWQQTAS